MSQFARILRRSDPNTCRLQWTKQKQSFSHPKRLAHHISGVELSLFLCSNLNWKLHLQNLDFLWIFVESLGMVLQLPNALKLTFSWLKVTCQANSSCNCHNENWARKYYFVEIFWKLQSKMETDQSQTFQFEVEDDQTTHILIVTFGPWTSVAPDNSAAVLRRQISINAVGVPDDIITLITEAALRVCVLKMHNTQKEPWNFWDHIELWRMWKSIMQTVVQCRANNIFSIILFRLFVVAVVVDAQKHPHMWFDILSICRSSVGDHTIGTDRIHDSETVLINNGQKATTRQKQLVWLFQTNDFLSIVSQMNSKCFNVPQSQELARPSGLMTQFWTSLRVEENSQWLRENHQALARRGESFLTWDPNFILADPGIELGSQRWEASDFTTTPPGLSEQCQPTSHVICLIAEATEVKEQAKRTLQRGDKAKHLKCKFAICTLRCTPWMRPFKILGQKSWIYCTTQPLCRSKCNFAVWTLRCTPWMRPITPLNQTSQTHCTTQRLCRGQERLTCSILFNCASSWVSRCDSNRKNWFFSAAVKGLFCLFGKTWMTGVRQRLLVRFRLCYFAVVFFLLISAISFLWRQRTIVCRWRRTQMEAKNWKASSLWWQIRMCVRVCVSRLISYWVFCVIERLDVTLQATCPLWREWLREVPGAMFLPLASFATVATARSGMEARFNAPTERAQLEIVVGNVTRGQSEKCALSSLSHNISVARCTTEFKMNCFTLFAVLVIKWSRSTLTHVFSVNICWNVIRSMWTLDCQRCLRRAGKSCQTRQITTKKSAKNFHPQTEMAHVRSFNQWQFTWQQCDIVPNSASTF